MATLRALPSVSRLLSTPPVCDLADTIPAGVLTDAARDVLARVRGTVTAATDLDVEIGASLAELAHQVAIAALHRHTPSLRCAINATGVVLHTGLGRARLASAACDALAAVAHDHSNLEIDPETGGRGSRRDHVRELLRELTGAEDATVVNNCAGAVFLAVTAFAQGLEVIISRGELVEIGGAFRMPDIVRAAGATLVEVGTTNRTRYSDYAAAITDRTGLILRCNPSNFAVVGFTEQTPTAELVALGREFGIAVLDDQGNGGLLDLFADKPPLGNSVRAGCDIITASADKLLGGPQAGMILGSTRCIEFIARHPLARALRVDKLTMAALEATLRLYRDPDRARREIPTLRYLGRTQDELRKLAVKLRVRLIASLPQQRFMVELTQSVSQVGGGSLPGEELPTTCVALRSTGGEPSPLEMAEALRKHRPAVFARIRDGSVLFDPRTLESDEIGSIARAAAELFGMHHV